MSNEKGRGQKTLGIVLKELPQRSFYKGEERIGNKNEMLDVRGWWRKSIMLLFSSIDLATTLFNKNTLQHLGLLRLAV